MLGLGVWVDFDAYNCHNQINLLIDFADDYMEEMKKTCSVWSKPGNGDFKKKTLQIDWADIEV